MLVANGGKPIILIIIIQLSLVELPLLKILLEAKTKMHLVMCRNLIKIIMFALYVLKQFFIHAI